MLFVKITEKQFAFAFKVKRCRRTDIKLVLKFTIFDCLRASYKIRFGSVRFSSVQHNRPIDSLRIIYWSADILLLAAILYFIKIYKYIYGVDVIHPVMLIVKTSLRAITRTTQSLPTTDHPSIQPSHKLDSAPSHRLARKWNIFNTHFLTLQFFNFSTWKITNMAKFSACFLKLNSPFS